MAKTKKRKSKASGVVVVPEVTKEKLPVIHDEVSDLLTRAIDKGLPVETMERLLAMRRELKAEAARESYFRSLAAFQSECPIIEKTKKVEFASKAGGRVLYSYAPIDAIVSAIRIPLRAHGFSYTITSRQDEGKVTVICTAHHAAGHSESTELTVPVDTAAKMSAAQKVAAALTYAKRYTICNIFGVVTGDEDTDAQDTGSENGKTAATKPSGPAKITEKQRALVRKLCKDNSLGMTAVTALIEERYKVKSGLDLTEKQGDDMIKYLKENDPRKKTEAKTEKAAN